MNPRHLETSIKDIPAGISERIEAERWRRLAGRVSDLRVVVRDRGLVLQGRSRTQHARQLAQQAVMEITELPILANEIQV
jgi:hypothetical protein